MAPDQPDSCPEDKKRRLKNSPLYRCYKQRKSAFNTRHSQIQLNVIKSRLPTVQPVRSSPVKRIPSSNKPSSSTLDVERRLIKSRKSAIHRNHHHHGGGGRSPQKSIIRVKTSLYSKKRARLVNREKRNRVIPNLISEATLSALDEGFIQSDYKSKTSNEDILKEFDRETIAKLANTSLDPERFLEPAKKPTRNYLDRTVDVRKLHKYILAYMDTYYDLRQDPNPFSGWREKLDEHFWDAIAYVIPILCRQTIHQLRHEGVVVSVEPECLVFGDIHGNLNDLHYMHKHIFQAKRYAQHKFIFVGDYVDRGSKSLEVIVLLMTMKLLEPRRMILLRGNHEISKVNKKYGFKSMVDTIYRDIGVNQKKLLHTFIYRSINDVFNNLPLASVIHCKNHKNVFCCHGGVPNESYNNNKPWTIEQLNKLGATYKPYDLVPRRNFKPEQLALSELLWNDPVTASFMTNEKSHHQGFFRNDKRGGHCSRFTELGAQRFLQANHLRLVIRGHQYKPTKEKGYYYHFSGQVLTVFSSSNYCGTERNITGMILVHESGQEPHTLRSLEESKHYHDFNRFEIEVDPKTKEIIRVVF